MFLGGRRAPGSRRARGRPSPASPRASTFESVNIWHSGKRCPAGHRRNRPHLATCTSRGGRTPVPRGGNQQGSTPGTLRSGARPEFCRCPDLGHQAVKVLDNISIPEAKDHIPRKDCRPIAATVHVERRLERMRGAPVSLDHHAIVDEHIHSADARNCELRLNIETDPPQGDANNRLKGRLASRVAMPGEPPGSRARRVPEPCHLVFRHEPLVERAVDHHQLIVSSDAPPCGVDDISSGVRPPAEAFRHVDLDGLRWPSVTSSGVAAWSKAHVKLLELPHDRQPQACGRRDACGVAVPRDARDVHGVGSRQRIHTSPWGVDRSALARGSERPIGHAREAHLTPARHPAAR